MQIELTEGWVLERKLSELKGAVRESALIRAYLMGEMSLGKFAEWMGMSYTESRKWLHQQGIATLRLSHDPTLESADEANYRKVSNELEIPAFYQHI